MTEWQERLEQRVAADLGDYPMDFNDVVRIISDHFPVRMGRIIPTSHYGVAGLQGAMKKPATVSEPRPPAFGAAHGVVDYNNDNVLEIPILVVPVGWRALIFKGMC